MQKCREWQSDPPLHCPGRERDGGRALTEEETGSTSALQDDFDREHRRDVQRIAWEGPLRRDLWPDQYVEVNVAGAAVEPGTVFRLSAKDWRLNKDSGRMELWDTYLCIKEADRVPGS